LPNEQAKIIRFSPIVLGQAFPRCHGLFRSSVTRPENRQALGEWFLKLIQNRIEFIFSSLFCTLFGPCGISLRLSTISRGDILTISSSGVVSYRISSTLFFGADLPGSAFFLRHVRRCLDGASGATQSNAPHRQSNNRQPVAWTGFRRRLQVPSIKQSFR